MKTKSIFYVMILIIIAGCTQQKPKFPQGAWKEISHKGYSGDSITFDFPGVYSGSDVKIWSESNWNDIGKFKHDTITINLYAGGTYKLEGNRCEESIQFHYSQKLVGQKIKALLEFTNDTLVQTYPVDENWKINKNEYYVAKFVRLE